MNSIQGLLTLFFISLLVIIGIIVMTYRSPLSSDRKLAVSIVTVFMPLLGLILFFIFKRKAKTQIN